MFGRILRSVRTRHHLRRPWYIPVTLIAELWGLCWAWMLARKGPALADFSHDGSLRHLPTEIDVCSRTVRD